jgi:hypothetical protein
MNKIAEILQGKVFLMEDGQYYDAFSQNLNKERTVDFGVIKT